MADREDKSITLLEATKMVLQSQKRYMKASEIAEEINIKSLYVQRSGKKVLPSQIEALTRKYRLALIRVNNTIGLI